MDWSKQWTHEAKKLDLSNPGNLQYLARMYLYEERGCQFVWDNYSGQNTMAHLNTIKLMADFVQFIREVNNETAN